MYIKNTFEIIVETVNLSEYHCTASIEARVLSFLPSLLIETVLEKGYERALARQTKAGETSSMADQEAVLASCTHMKEL